MLHLRYVSILMVALMTSNDSSIDSTQSRSKREKFLELANKRVSRAIKDLQLVSNLANRKNYQYSEDEAKKIIRALQTEVDRIKQQFQTGTQAVQSNFKL
jgi:hypothetical protein